MRTTLCTLAVYFGFQGVAYASTSTPTSAGIDTFIELNLDTIDGPLSYMIIMAGVVVSGVAVLLGNLKLFVFSVASSVMVGFGQEMLTSFAGITTVIGVGDLAHGLPIGGAQ